MVQQAFRLHCGGDLYTAASNCEQNQVTPECSLPVANVSKLGKDTQHVNKTSLELPGASFGRGWLPPYTSSSCAKLAHPGPVYLLKLVSTLYQITSKTEKKF